MDADALQALEFVAITERLARATQTPRGAELALALVPSADPDEVARRQGLAAEAVTLLDEAVEPPLHGIHDVREAVELAARGGVLTPDAVSAVASTISGGLRARAALEEQEAPLLREIGDAVEPGLARVADEVRRAIEEDGS